MSADVFISYAHADDRRAAPDGQGWITTFLAALHAEHRRITTADLSVFFDNRAIQVAEDWNLRIRGNLRGSSLLLAFVSPDYFASEWCRREWDLYVQHESERALSGEGFLPLYLVEVENGAASSAASEWSRDVARRQRMDLRRWKKQGLRAFDDHEMAKNIELLDQQISLLIERARRATSAPGTVERSNATFVGRADELRALRGLLIADAPTGAIVAVYGLGGLGKSALVTQYAHLFAGEYPGGRWTLRCEGQPDLAAVLTTLASPLGIEFTREERRDRIQGLNRVMAELEQRTRAAAADAKQDPACLLLLDNVDDPALVSPEQVALLPRKPWLHLVMTTRLGRDQLYEGEADRGFLALDELPVDQAVQLIERHQPDQRFRCDAEGAAAKAISERLGGFPLAVEAVAVFLGLNPEVTCAAFRQRLDDEGLAAPENLAGSADVSNRLRHREKQLGAVFAPMHAQLDPVEQFVLDAASVLPADHVPIAWLRKWAAARFPERAAAKPGYADPWMQSVRRLIGRRLWVPVGDAEPDGSPRMVRMHRLLQEWIAKRDGFPGEELIALVRQHAESRREAVSRGWTDPGIRWEMDPLAAIALQRLAARDSTGIMFASSIAALLQRQARFLQAEDLLSSAVALEEQTNGTSTELAILLGALGGLFMAIARYADAEVLLQRALQIDRSLLGDQDKRVATDLNNVGALLYVSGRLPEAVEFYGQAVSVYEKACGPESEQVAVSLGNLGLLFQGQARLDEAEAAMRRSVDIQAKCYGPDDVRRAVPLLNLGRLLHFRGQPDEAESLVRRSIALEEGHYGSDYKGLGTSLMYLADIVAARGEKNEAELLLRRALTMCEAAYGPNHPEIARICTSLGNLLAEREEWVESETMARRALVIDEATLGEDGANTLSDARLLMVVLMNTGRVEEAAGLGQRCLAGALRFMQENGQPQPDLMFLHNTYRELLLQEHDVAAVDRHLQELYAMFGIKLKIEPVTKTVGARRKRARQKSAR